MSVDIVSAFVFGLVGGSHCIGMCGGFVSALTFSLGKHQNPIVYQVLYNLGRILSYVSFGALMGYLGNQTMNMLSLPLEALRVFSAVFLALMALYIMNLSSLLTVLEKAGSGLWKKLQPLSKQLLPVNSPPKAVLYGVVWGWLPCGLVYSMLTWSVASGSAGNGALTMLAFGLGTSPVLLLLGGFAHQAKGLLQSLWFKRIAGSLMLLYSAYLIMISLQ